MSTTGHAEHAEHVLSTVIRKLQLAIAHGRSLYGHTISDGRSLFAAIDEDGSETISSTEFREAMQRLDLGLSHKEVDRIAEHLETKSNFGSIDVLTFLEWTGLQGTSAAERRREGTRDRSSSNAERAVRERQQELRRLRMRANAAPPSGAANAMRAAEKTEKAAEQVKLVGSTVMQQLRQAVKHQRSLYGHSIVDARALFAAIDKDGSGSVAPAEFCDALTRLSLGVADEQLREMIGHIDTNANGKIEFDEMLEATGLSDPGIESSGAAAVRAAQTKQLAYQQQSASAVAEKYVAAATADRQHAALSRIIRHMKAAVSVRGGRTLFGHKITDIPSLFAAIDQDRSGYITRAELSAGLKRLDCLHEADINDIVQTMDTDGNNRIDLREFLDAVSAVTGRDTEQQDTAAATLVRKEQETLLQQQRAAATKARHPLDNLDAKERRAMFDRIDANGNGIISLAELDKSIATQWPHLDHKAALIRAFKCADLNHDGFIVGEAEFAVLLRALVYFNNLFELFDAHDLHKEHRLNEEEFIAASAKMFHGREEAQAAFTELATAHHGRHVLFYEFCDWCYSLHERLGVHDSTIPRPVGASAAIDAQQAAAERRRALDIGAKRTHVHEQKQESVVAPLAHQAMPPLVVVTASATGVQIEGERLPVPWNSPRMRAALAVVAVNPIDLLPQPEGRRQQSTRDRFKSQKSGLEMQADDNWIEEALRKEQYEERQRLKLLTKVVKCRHSIVAAGGTGLALRPKTVERSHDEVQHHAVGDNHTQKTYRKHRLGETGSLQPPSRGRHTTTPGSQHTIMTSTMRAPRTGPLALSQRKCSEAKLGLKRRIDARLKVALPCLQNRDITPSRSSSRAGDAGVGVLDLGSSHIGDEGMRLLCGSLRAHAATSQPLPLTAIHLNGCDLTAKGARELATVLGLKVTVPALRVLNVNHNPKLGDAGVITLVNMLPVTIQLLQLTGVGCGDSGMEALAQRVASLPSLEKVSCGSNEAISQRGWMAIAVALRAMHGTVEPVYKD